MSPHLDPTEDDLAFFAEHKVTDAGLKRRMLMERAIIRTAIGSILKAGYEVRLHNGEDWSCERTSDWRVIMAALMQTDEELLRIYQWSPKTERWLLNGFIKLVYGNDGWDVICDNSTWLDDQGILAEASALSDKLSEAA